jgi:hypothetical protein
MSTTITTVWADHLGTEIRHTRRVESAVTLCGLGTNLTRNFVRRVSVPDQRCQRCQVELDAINARRFEDTEPRIDSATFPSNEEGW